MGTLDFRGRVYIYTAYKLDVIVWLNHSNLFNDDDTMYLNVFSLITSRERFLNEEGNFSLIELVTWPVLISWFCWLREATFGRGQYRGHTSIKNKLFSGEFLLLLDSKKRDIKLVQVHSVPYLSLRPRAVLLARQDTAGWKVPALFALSDRCHQGVTWKVMVEGVE